ncbi:hypothetical protein QUF74_14270, partial [Candidatus Halobeggiatoa sp. HSG11]|nr:hypothetical protein [Candidatus Halobeggiatoa sp. HSG11]
FAGTAFTYQGQLNDSGAAVTATCTMDFKLSSTSGTLTQVGTTQTKSVSVANGLFTISNLDFGNQFDGNDRWLDITVDCGSGATTLTPRQPLTPIPYAIHAQSVSGIDSTAITDSTTYVLPATDGANGQVLSTDASGNLSWVAASGAVTSASITDDEIVNADINASAGIVDTKLATIATAGKVANTATTATNANTNSAIVARDATGNFSAGTITASLTGNVTGNADTATALAANGTNCAAGEYPLGVDASGSVEGCTASGSGDMTKAVYDVANNGKVDADKVDGVTGGTVDNSVIGGTTPAAGTFTSLTGESANLTLGKTGTAGTGTIVLHDNQVDNFTTTIKAADDVNANVAFTLPAALGTNGQVLSTDASGNLSWTAASGAVTSANITDGEIVDADVSASAGIVDTKLATIATAGKVANTATTATDANTNSTIVARDATGNFSAGTITASLTGNVTGAVTGNASTATALAANGANCAAGQYPLGVDASGAVESCTVGAGADNLGNHTATTNIQLGANYLSGDGGNEGITVDTTGDVGIGGYAPSTANGRLVISDGDIEIDHRDGPASGIIFHNLNRNNWKLYREYNAGAETTEDMHLRYNSTDYVTYAVDGNVGIGKDPTTKLDVNGTITATGFTGNGSGLTNINGTVPTGGTAGQMLSKINATDYNTTWSSIGLNDLSDGATASNSFYLGTNAGGAGGGDNVGFGYDALANNTNNANVAIGQSALMNNTSYEGVAVGYQALKAQTSSADGNVAVGGRALTANTTGNHNVAIGRIALGSNTTGSSNIAIGASAGTGNYSNKLYIENHSTPAPLIGGDFSNDRVGIMMNVIDGSSLKETFNVSGTGYFTQRVGIGTVPNASAMLDVNGAIYQRGTSLHADYVFESDYKLTSIEEHAAYMWQEKHLPAVPKARKDKNGNDILEVGSHRKGMLEELEKAHVYIEQLNSQFKVQRVQIKTLQAENALLKAKLEQVDAMQAQLLQVQALLKQMNKSKIVQANLHE